MDLPSPRLAPRCIRAWHANIALLTALPIAPALAWLTTDERQRHDRFSRDEDRRMFLLGRLMARLIVGRALGIRPTAWQWREGPHGRPEIASPAGRVHFNLAHSDGLVVCALADDREVGVDLEYLRRRPVELAVVHRYCAPAEIADIEAHGERWHDRFLRYWTLKEAYVKALGLGISMPLAEISFSATDAPLQISFSGSLSATDTRWTFHLVQPTADHLIAVAAPVADDAALTFSVEAMPVDWLHAALA